MNQKEQPLDTIMVIAAFSIAAIASKEIGKYFARAKLPLITGFMFAGMISGGGENTG